MKWFRILYIFFFSIQYYLFSVQRHKILFFLQNIHITINAHIYPGSSRMGNVRPHLHRSIGQDIIRDDGVLGGVKEARLDGRVGEGCINNLHTNATPTLQANFHHQSQRGCSTA